MTIRCFSSGLFLLMALFAMVLPSPAQAHALDQAYIFLRVYDQSVGGRFEATSRDLNRALGLSLPTDDSGSREDLEPHIEQIQAYFRKGIALDLDGKPAEIHFGGFNTYKTEVARFVTLEWELDPVAQLPEKVGVDYNVFFEIDPAHRGFLVIEHHWKSGRFLNEAGISLVFSPKDHKQDLDLTSTSFFRGFVGLVKLGIHHIWIGIDHILFLVALLLPAVVRWKEGRWTVVENFRSSLSQVIKIVTLFTVAHSVSLSLAALGVVSFPSRAVESIIALSIAVAAVDILYPVFRGRILWVVLAFGFFHGFGFASVLGDIGIASKNMVWALLGFNIGVEIGQAVIVVLIFPLLYLLAKVRLYPRFLLPAGAIFLTVVSLYWFIERAFEVDIPAGVLAKNVLGMFS